MTLAIVVLALVLLAREVQRALEQRQWGRERTTLLNRILADTPAELVALERLVPGAKPAETPEVPRPGPVAVGMS